VFRDLYVAMDRQDGADAWTLRIQIKPFVRWIWAGCALMAAGGVLAATNRRRVRVAAPDSAQVTLAGETGR
jgi:cytochrome c-type biogenesis protein CcmF